MPRRLIYPEIKGFEYSAHAELSNRPLAVDIERWTRVNYNLASPAGKILPVFLHCPGSKALTEVNNTSLRNTSLYNPIQNDVAIELAERLIENNEDLTARDIVMITPYRANRHCLEVAIAAKSLTGVSVTTTDSFQGSEGDVVIVVLCVTEATGARFVADSRRICVSLSRQKTGLFLVGDIETIPESERDNQSLK